LPYFFATFKNVFLSKNSPQFISQLAIWDDLVLFGPKKTILEVNLEGEIWKGWSSSRLVATIPKNSKNS